MNMKTYNEFNYFLGILQCMSAHTYDIVKNEDELFEIWNLMRHESTNEEIISYILDENK